MGKKIFVDAGANVGQSIEAFLREFPDSEKYEIHAFEPGIPYLELAVNYGDYSRVSLYKKAAWVSSGIRTFYQDTVSIMGGSSLLKEKNKLGYVEATAETICLSEWLQTLASSQDEVLLKMDVEGAEYSIIPDLVSSGAIDLVNKIFCEIHGAKCKKDFQESIDLIRLLRDRSKKIYVWDALTFKYDEHENLYYTEEFMEKEFKKWQRRGIYVE